MLWQAVLDACIYFGAGVPLYDNCVLRVCSCQCVLAHSVVVTGLLAHVLLLIWNKN